MLSRVKRQITRFIKGLRKPRQVSEREQLIQQLMILRKSHKPTKEVQKRIRAITLVQLENHVARIGGD